MAAALRQFTKGITCLWSTGVSQVVNRQVIQLCRPSGLLCQNVTNPQPATFSSQLVNSYMTSCNKGHTIVQNAAINLNRPLLGVTTVTCESRRHKIYFSRHKGQAKSVKAVTERFLRLDSGIWIRPRAGRRKKLWKKSCEKKRRLRQHVFLNKTQSNLLDKMVEGYWKEKKYYVDDPYEPYHKRHGMPLHWYEPPRFLP